ncbi:MAG: LPXTG cell wall anchor domain-containing protein [Actinomycetota bacterium]
MRGRWSSTWVFGRIALAGLVMLIVVANPSDAAAQDSDDEVCVLIRQALGSGPDAAASAATARELLSPSPPGIDAALALVAEQISVEESPFHDSVAEAQAQLGEYFAQCADELPRTGADDTGVLVAAGITLIALGAAAVRAGRVSAESIRS